MAGIDDARSRRDFLKLTGYATTGALLAACLPSTPTASSPTPAGTSATAAPSGAATGSPAARTLGKYQLGKLEGPRVISDATKFPKTFKEAPAFASLVQQGKLPPVADRIGQDPIVVQPLRAVGKYGGKSNNGPEDTIRRGFNYLGGDVNNFVRFGSGPDTFITWDWDWKALRPNIARSFEMSADQKTLTINLRRGMRWSNGDPVTTEDVRFWYEDIYQNPGIVSSPASAMRINGKDLAIKIVDPTTFQIVSPDPHPFLPSIVASAILEFGGFSYFGNIGYGLISPSKYMKQFHPKYASGGQAAVDKMAADAKFPGWAAFFLNQNTVYNNADLPSLSPWVLRKGSESNKQVWAMDRNPYSVWVDVEGNQLPYIGTLQWTYADSSDVMNLRAIAGEYDVADRFIDMAKLPLLIDGQSKGDYKLQIDPGEDNNLGLRMNWGWQTAKSDPDYEVFELLRTADFRRALSLGLDRNQFNEAFFLGTGSAGSFVPQHDSNPYYPGDEAAHGKWALYDPAQANKLLDGLGYTQKDAQGYRLRKDGKGRIILQYLCSIAGGADLANMGEMMKTQWAKIGLDTNVSGVQTALFIQKRATADYHFIGFSIGSAELFLAPDFAFLTSQPYTDWFRSNGAKGTEPFKELKDLMALWTKGFTSADADRVQIGKQWFAQAADIVLQIGIIGADISSYGLRLSKSNVENVPGRAISTGVTASPVDVLPQHYFYK